MDLYEYIFYQKRKNRSYGRDELAKELGISKNYLAIIMTFKRLVTSTMAYKITKVTNGKVSGWYYINEYFKRQDEVSKETN